MLLRKPLGFPQPAIFSRHPGSSGGEFWPFWPASRPVCLASARLGRGPWPAFRGVFLAIVGFADDHGALAAAPRLGAQLAVGALVGVTTGGGWWILAGMICIPVAVNVVNFMDGINGITSLNVAAWGFVAMAVGYAQHESSLVVIGAVTAGSTTAFLPWNAPVARLFLGDVGSYLLGALVGIGIVIGAHQTPVSRGAPGSPVDLLWPTPAPLSCGALFAVSS